MLRETPDRRRAEAWSLVLEALAIPHRLAPGAAGWSVSVEDEWSGRAGEALDAHDREQREAREAVAADPAPPDLGPSASALLVPLGLVGFFLLSGPRGASDGFRAGSALASRLLHGEPWRAVTALTLHADLAHVAGNAVALAVFLSALARWLGAGPAWFLTVLAGAAGNVATAAVHDPRHDSVGASTAAFAAVGLLGALQIVRRLRQPRVLPRRRRALDVVAACLGLFAMLGVGERSDVVAHVMGLGAGLALGLAVAWRLRGSPARPWRLGQGGLAVAVVLGSWALAFR